MTVPAKKASPAKKVDVIDTTGAIVEGLDGIKKAFEKGKGKVIVRAKTEIIEEKNMNQIVVTEIPYEVNKAELVRKIDEIRFNKIIDGILNIYSLFQINNNSQTFSVWFISYF